MDPRYADQPDPRDPRYSDQSDPRDPRYSDQPDPRDPRYADQPDARDQYGGQPLYNDSQNDSFYADTPDRGGYNGPHDPPPIDPPSRSDSYRHPQDGYGGEPPPPMDGRYNDTGYNGPPNDRYPDNSYDEDPYRGSHPDAIPGYRESPVPGYRESPVPGSQPFIPEDRFRDMSLNEPPQGQLPPNDSYREQPSQDSYGYGGGQEPQTYGDYDDHPYASTRKHEGLPEVQSDPFADDPFQAELRASQANLRSSQGNLKTSQGNLMYPGEDPYGRGPPSPGVASDRYGGRF